MKTKQGATGIKRVINASVFSWQGLQAAFKNEAAFRQECVLTILLAPVGLFLGNSSSEKTLLVAALLLVLIIELLNSALEAVVDRFGGELHELSGRAKDIGSAAVFVALLNVILVWTIILLG